MRVPLLLPRIVPAAAKTGRRCTDTAEIRHSRWRSSLRNEGRVLYRSRHNDKGSYCDGAESCKDTVVPGLFAEQWLRVVVSG